MSSEFMTTVEDLQPPDQPIRVSQVIQCSTDIREDDLTPGLVDFSCYLAGALSGGAADACTLAADSQGINCVAMDTPMTGSMCLTNTQATFASWLLDLMDDMGLDESKIPLEVDEAVDEFVQEMEDVMAIEPTDEEPEAVENEEDKTEDEVDAIESTEDELEVAEEEEEEMEEEKEDVDEGDLL
jgi:hypothetical protein